MALDLTEEWDALQADSETPSTLVTGVVVARTDFAEEHPEVVSAFLDHYQESVEYVNANVEEAAQLVGQYEIVTAEVAQKALPECNIVFIEGAEMKEKLSGYLSVLFEQNSSVRRRCPARRRLLFQPLTSMKGRRTIRAWAVIFWLLLWQAGAMAIDQRIILVSPLRVLARLAELAPTLEFWGAIGYSLVRITAGFLLGVAAGTLLAALSARFRRVEELLAPALLAIKSIPVASFIILALILFSSRNLAVLISFLIVLPVLYTNLLSGIRAADPQLLEMARVFRVPALRGIRYVYLPQVLPYFRSACGSALGLCWKSGIAAEVIGMPDGSIGEQLQQAKIYLNTPDLFAWTLVIVLVSLIFEKVFLALLKRGERALERM